MIASFGAENLEPCAKVYHQRKRDVLSIGFYVWRPDSDKRWTQRCFTRSADNDSEQIILEIERHLDARMIRNEKSYIEMEASQSNAD